MRVLLSHLKVAYPAIATAGTDPHSGPVAHRLLKPLLKDARLYATGSSVFLHLPAAVHGLSDTLAGMKTLCIGAVAGATSRTLTAPMDRVKVVLQAGSNAGISQTFRKLYAEGGWVAFYKGNGVNVLKIAPETAIKFYSNSVLTSSIARDSTNVSVFERLAAGGLAGVIAQTVIYPLEIIKTRLALSKPGEFNGIISCVRETVRRNGIGAFKRGYVPSVVGIIPYAGVELAVFNTLKDQYTLETGEKPTVVHLLSFGCAASMCGQVVAYPLNLVRTRMQAQGMEGRPVEYRGMADCFKKILVTEGPRGLYRGILPGFMKTLPAISISYAVFETLKGL